LVSTDIAVAVLLYILGRLKQNICTRSRDYGHIASLYILPVLFQLFGQLHPAKTCSARQCSAGLSPAPCPSATPGSLKRLHYIDWISNVLSSPINVTHLAEPVQYLSPPDAATTSWKV